MSAGHVWQLTFVDIYSKNAFLTDGNFQTREGAHAFVIGFRKNRCVVRVHWTPFHVPMTALVRAFEANKALKVISVSYDRSNSCLLPRSDVRFGTDNIAELSSPLN